MKANTQDISALQQPVDAERGNQHKEATMADIGKEKKIIEVMPLEEPAPAREPEREPVREPEKTPA